jgi:hypothetical protein
MKVKGKREKEKRAWRKWLKLYWAGLRLFVKLFWIKKRRYN